MKNKKPNKKPKTIEDLFKNGFVVTNIVQPYTYEAKKEFIKQIKQLIADEVIENSIGELKALLISRSDTNIIDTPLSICSSFEQQQRKKLEKL